MTTEELLEQLRGHCKGEGWVDEEWGPLRSPLTDFPPSKKCRGESSPLPPMGDASVPTPLRTYECDDLPQKTYC